MLPLPLPLFNPANPVRNKYRGPPLAVLVGLNANLTNPSEILFPGQSSSLPLLCGIASLMPYSNEATLALGSLPPQHPSSAANSRSSSNLGLSWSTQANIAFLQEKMFSLLLRYTAPH